MSSVCVITRAVLKEHTEPVLTSFYLEKDKLTEIHPHLEGRSLLGNIYVGKVKHVVKNIDAAFVEIAGGQTCYLPFKEAQAPVLTNRRWDGRLLAGDEILVQVMRDALKTKEPALTAKISLEGRLAAVVLDGGHGVRYSKQLPKEAADHFREVLQSVTVPDGMTLVVRTAAGDAADTALLHEANALLEKAQKLLSKIAYINHDIDDAIRGRIITEEELPDRYTDVLGHDSKERLNTLIHDVIDNSMDQPDILMSSHVEEAMLGMRRYMFDHVYTNPKAKNQETKAQNLLRELYEYYMKYTEQMPEEYRRLITDGRCSRERAVCDYLSGMTDQYTIETYEELYIPKAWKIY